MVPDVEPTGYEARLDHCQPEALAQVFTQSAGLLEVELPQDGALEIARRTRGTPRIVNRLLRRARDL